MKVDISAILPQRPPFVMVDEFLSYSPETVRTALTVRADNIFFEDGILAAEGLLENFAQTCAARIGYINKYILHKDVNIGYIGAVKNWGLVRLPRGGERIITRIDVIQEIGPMVKVRACAWVAPAGQPNTDTSSAPAPDTLLASGEMTIALSDIAVAPAQAEEPSRQRIIVEGGTLTFWEEAPNGTRRELLRCACAHGRNGFAIPRPELLSSAGLPAASASGAPQPSALPVKCEGDGRTPIGTYPIEFAFGLASNPGTTIEYRPIGPNSWWSGAPESYNTWVESTAPLEGERLADYPVQYKYAAAIGYNTAERIYGAGSAIFLHCFGPSAKAAPATSVPGPAPAPASAPATSEASGSQTPPPPTAGCISVPEDAMLSILRLLRPGATITLKPSKENG